MNILVKNRLFARDRVYSCAGSRYEPVKELMVDDDGIDRLTIVGKVDVAEKINSYRDTCDLGLLLQKFKVTGDPNVLNVRETFYADVTEVPTNFHELTNYMRKVEANFLNLPLEVREKYGHNMFTFMKDFEGSVDAIKKEAEEISKVETPVSAPVDVKEGVVDVKE